MTCYFNEIHRMNYLYFIALYFYVHFFIKCFDSADASYCLVAVTVTNNEDST